MSNASKTSTDLPELLPVPLTTQSFLVIAWVGTF